LPIDEMDVDIGRALSPSPEAARQDGGFSYVAILILTTTLGLLAVTFISRLGIGTAAVAHRSASIQAEYLAEAAVNHAIWRLQNEPGFPASEDTYTMHSLGAGRYGYRVRRHTPTTFATIAAIGSVGRTVVEESYVVGFRDVPREMVTGTYQGNGWNGRSIGGLGFRPDLVILKSAGSRSAVLRTSTMTGDVSKVMVGSTAPASNLIESLNADGFTVGSDQLVNEWGTNIYWAAFRAVPERMAVGTYVGDGTADRTIGGAGFAADLAIVISEGTGEVLFASSLSGGSFNFSNGAVQANCILMPPPADGFRIGGDTRVNQSGRNYHFICWPEETGKQKFGVYTGTDTDHRAIGGLGFLPEYVIVKSVSTANLACQRPASLSGDRALYFTNLAVDNDRIESLAADVFMVRKRAEVNGLGVTYVYFAWMKR
jgi:hypothetical protein